MNTGTIKEQLHNYLELADDKKLRAIYTMVEDEIKDYSIKYTTDVKADLDQRVNYYLKGGKMVSSSNMNKRIDNIKRKRR